MASYNISDKALDFERGCIVDLDLETGLSMKLDTGKRMLSQMKGMFADDKAFDEIIEKKGDQLVYEFHSMPVPDHAGDLAFGCSIVYPGKVGDEYYFTKGHFHVKTCGTSWLEAMIVIAEKEPALYREINESGDLPGIFKGLGGNVDRIHRVEYVDQNPIGHNSRSNAATYLKAFDDKNLRTSLDAESMLKYVEENINNG